MKDFHGEKSVAQLKQQILGRSRIDRENISTEKNPWPN